MTKRDIGLFVLVAVLLVGTGLLQSWNAALYILNYGLISAVMALR
ncbi:branched-chain amino acid ABC transporter permease, partial [Rhodovulum sulfidophilum]|nr:branched-chain amino acid ABC transporter permease [Rhodovulum sulfidophilum]